MPRTAKEIEDSRATLSTTLTIIAFIVIAVGGFFLFKKFLMDIIEDFKEWVEDDDQNNLINLVLSSLVVSAVISLILHYIAFQPLAEVMITE
jgi:uncharacterized membrane protein (DUF373 family)